MGNFSEGIHSNFRTMRRTGYTYHLAEMCKEKGFNLIAATQDQVNLLKRDFPNLKCISLDQINRMQGATEPFYLDNSALVEILYKWENAEKDLDSRTTELTEMTKKNNLLLEEFIRLRDQVCDEQMKNSELAEKLTALEIYSKRSFLRRSLDYFKNLFNTTFFF